MPLIILGVLVFGGLIALVEISRNTQMSAASSYGEAHNVTRVINLPTDIEREKKRRNII